jgi:hypothetical protein
MCPGTRERGQTAPHAHAGRQLREGIGSRDVRTTLQREKRGPHAVESAEDCLHVTFDHVEDRPA